MPAPAPNPSPFHTQWSKQERKEERVGRPDNWNGARGKREQFALGACSPGWQLGLPARRRIIPGRAGVPLSCRPWAVH